MPKKSPRRLVYLVLGLLLVAAVVSVMYWKSPILGYFQKQTPPESAASKKLPTASAPAVWMPGSPEAIDEANKKMATERSARLNQPSTNNEGGKGKVLDPAVPPKAEPTKEAAKAPSSTASPNVSGTVAQEKNPVGENSCKARIAEAKEAIRNCGGDPEDVSAPKQAATKAPDSHPAAKKKEEKKEAKVPTAKFWAYITPGASDQHPLPCFANMPVATKAEKCSSMTFVPSEPRESYDVWSSRGYAKVFR